MEKDYIQIINQIFGDKVYKFKDHIDVSMAFDSEFDFKFKVVGVKNLYTAGEPTDYLWVHVTIFNFKDVISNYIFNNDETLDRLEIDKRFYFLSLNLISKIKKILSAFDINNPIVIGQLDIKKNNPIITESNMNKSLIRTVVKDVVKKLKSGKKGVFRLPENDLFYPSINDTSELNIELHIKHNTKQKKFFINGTYNNEDDLIDLTIEINPNDIESYLYDIIGELNEILAHEIEHMRQDYSGEFEYQKSEEIEPIKYYTQDHELKAQIAGFRRLSKLRKLPINKVILNWFETHKDIHNLNEKEQKIVIDKLLNMI